MLSLRIASSEMLIRQHQFQRVTCIFTFFAWLSCGQFFSSLTLAAAVLPTENFVGTDDRAISKADQPHEIFTQAAIFPVVPAIERADILTVMERVADWQIANPGKHPFPARETSGSGFYTYALAWGVNEGLLDRARFETTVRRAWTALVACVTSEGKLTHVQPIGGDPQRFKENATEIYGVGAMLLAGSEVYRLAWQ